MELARIIILEIAAVSQHIVSAATEYARRRGFRNVQSSHFRLEKEMQRISVAAGGILGVLAKSSLPDGPPLDDRLQEWFSTDELPTCLDTLHEMDKMLRNDTWMNTLFNFVNVLRPSVPEDRIGATVKLFDSRRNYFHFLLTTDVWNCEEFEQAQHAHARDESAVELVCEPDVNVMEVDQDSASVSLNAEKRPTIAEEKEAKQVDDRRKIDDILQWLDGLSCAAKQEETLSLRQPDTCTWLHSTHEYESWRNGNDSFLWLQGKPGSGKTVLTSFVVDSLRNKRHSGEALAFFYCDFRNDRSTIAAEVMRSLLSQLLRHMRNENIDPGELVDDLVKAKNGDTPFFKNVSHLAVFISQTAKQFSHQPLVAVDALDECKDIDKLLDGLRTLAKDGMRVFVTSRPLQVIKDGLRGFLSVSMDKMTSAVSMDIALHVTRELDSRRRLRDLELGLKTEIHSVLCDRADGMFRWVQCQIDTLNRCATKAEVREALGNLPIGLDETYQRILVAIDIGSPEGKLALRALVWLVGALRPLRLVEILDGLTIDLEKRAMDPDTGPMHKGALLDACGSLVSYNEDTEILILSHFSVKEYLTGDLTRIKLPRYHINYQGAHEHLARLCICYINLYLKHIHRSNDESSEKTPLGRIMRIIGGQSHGTTEEWCHVSMDSPGLPRVSRELLGYVLTNGFNHLAHLGSVNHAVLKDIIILQSDIQHHPVAWEVVHQMSQRSNHSVQWPRWEHDVTLYILIVFASDSLLRAFLGPTRRALRPKYRTNPLIYAAHFGKDKHAQLLLSRGARVNERGLVVDTSRCALPLEVAVSRQHDAIVDLLLSTGSIVPKQLFALTTNHNFPIRISRRLLQTDEFAEWTAEQGNRLHSPIGLLERRLSVVYERDIILMIRRLVQVGLDPATRNSAQKTALDLAIVGGYQAVVVYLFLVLNMPFPFDFITAVSKIISSKRTQMLRLIVDLGIDIRTQGRNEDTILHWTIWNLEQDECLEVVRILVDAGCDPCARNAVRKTPFYLALEHGYSLVADYLLLKIPLSDVMLAAVVESRCPTAWKVATLQVLIDRGGNIHSMVAHGVTLLHRAVVLPDEYDGLEVARFLFSAGCDPFRRGANGRTPLDLALDRERSLLADYLLSTVETPPPNSLFRILHSTLPAPWRAQKICSLVGQGTDASGLSADGNTLLHAAVLFLDDLQSLEVARSTVSIGVDPFKQNAHGNTPLDLALDRKFPLFVEYLLSAGRPVPPDALFSILRSALPGDWRAQKICSLIDQGANASELSAGENTLLHATVLSLDESHALEVAKLLLSAGCDPLRCNAQGKTTLDLALERKFPLLADCLLYTGSPPPSDALFSVLHSALPAPWRAQTIYSLVSKGADMQGRSADGSTLLHTAVLVLDECDGLAMAKTLVGTGCEPLSLNNADETPLHIALKQGYSSIADYLLSVEKPSISDALFAVLTSKCSLSWITEKLRSFINEGADIHSVTANGNSLIHAVVASQSEDASLELLKHLVDYGCNPSAHNGKDETALHIATIKGFIPVIQYILSLDQSLPHNILFTALKSHSSRILRVLHILINNGANTRATEDGDTLLHVAISSYRYFGCSEHFLLSIMKTLLSSGCDHLASNSHGKTVLHLAVAEGCVYVVKNLLSIIPLPHMPPDILACALDRKGARAQDMLRVLIGKRANVHVRVTDGSTLLHMAIKNDLKLRTLPGGCHAPPANSISPSPDAPSPTSLHEALHETRGAAVWIATSENSRNSQRSDHLLGIVKILVNSGCNPSDCDDKGHPPVYFAISKGHVSVVEYLLPRTVPLPLSDLWSATNFAALNVRRDLRKLLIRWESDV